MHHANTINRNETHQTALAEERQLLEANMPLTFTPEANIYGQPELAAVIQASSDENAEYHAADGVAVDRLMVVDMRTVPPSNYPGYKSFGGELVSAQADYFIIDPLNLDFKNGQGYKALRAGESFTYGRPTESTPAGDKRQRFKNASSVTSRNHFTIAVGEDGELSVTDLDSSNQTTVITGESAHQALAGHERQIHALALAPQIGRALVRNTIDNKVDATETSRIIILGKERAAKLQEKAYDPNQAELVRELLFNHPELAPKGGVKIGEYDFIFSNIVADRDGRKHAVAYVEGEDGQVKPRFFYKSNSEGGWRTSPGIYDDTKSYSKGTDTADGGYVQLTKPVEEISQYLEAIEKQGVHYFQRKKFEDLFTLNKLKRQGLNDFDSQVTATRFTGRKQKPLYDNYQPGIGFTNSAKKARRELAELQLPEGFEPSFESVERQYTGEHSLAGKTTFNVYSAELEGRPVEWHMAQSQFGDTWVDKIVFKDAKVTSYGTYSEVILAGALSAKPYEYQHQLKNMERGVDFEGTPGNDYARLKPMWDSFPVIRRFKAKVGK